MTTFALPNLLKRRSKSLSVVTRTNPPAQAYSRILRSPPRARPFLSALSDSGKRSRKRSTSFGERLSSKRSFILRRIYALPPVPRHKRIQPGSPRVRVEDSQQGLAVGMLRLRATRESPEL